VITCVVDYTIDPRKTAEFERFARAWIGLDPAAANAAVAAV
jgi:hypothetical protein